MELMVIGIALISLIISFFAMYYSRMAFTLSLFDKRYKLFYDFKILVNKLLLNFNERDLPEYLHQIRLLQWEAQYIFDNDICTLLDDIKRNISGCIRYFSVANEMADSQKPEDSPLFHKLKVEHYDPMQILPSTLLGNDESLNLNFYFNKYLTDKDFKKPLPKCFLKVF